jgi:hypothetical protein
MTGPTARLARVTPREGALCVLLCTLALSVSASAKHPTIITFDPPGSILTEALAINPAGTIAGGYLDASNVVHGFLRVPDGTFTTFDAPGAGTGIGQGTIAFSINPAGAITGYYIDGGNVPHGFLRARDGTITTFDAPDAGTGAFQGTYAFSINPAGGNRRNLR